METTVKGTNSQTQSGYIKTLITRKGFGFITSDDGIDLFFHMAGVVGLPFENLREGMPVEFIAVDGKKGPKAIGIVAK